MKRGGKARAPTRAKTPASTSVQRPLGGVSSSARGRAPWPATNGQHRSMLGEVSSPRGEDRPRCGVIQTRVQPSPVCRNRPPVLRGSSAGALLGLCKHLLQRSPVTVCVCFLFTLFICLCAVFFLLGSSEESSPQGVRTAFPRPRASSERAKP